ncbi:MAG: SCP2 sterol-binding domain-containing protein [Actinomycetota bacterium]
MPVFASQAWFEAFAVEINASSDYREAAADWEGDIAFRILAEPDRGVPGDLWGYLDLWHGACRGARSIPAAEGDVAAYILTAPYSRWRDIVEGELDPIKGMMQGKLRVRGDLPTIVRYVKAANELVRLTGLIDTQFPDEA